ncbi:MAG: QueG-associated DUF1730 domain-containing protein [Peptoniphilus sp.]|nr:QueG-associated DUF1730 domain-containing protein [Peptoniphilus sp.]MDD7363610.1 DUF1730 domain-containing protein [Bacillota bacterium]MDY6045199.1 QueG-associated DUF1730 domain-containing protein [Peptoniphilus sp.]
MKRAAGFHDLAWVPARRLDGVASILRRRAESGERLPIEPEGIDARIDPRCSLAGAHSVFVAFEQTPFSAKEPKSVEGYGRLAGISRDVDYHILLSRKIEKLEALLKLEYPEVKTYRQVDTGPLYERGFAALTGRGYIGRNGSFIHERLGSYVAIGLLVTDIEGGETAHPSDSCGTCDACVRACPGRAIEESGKLYPTRCRSWITQKRGELTEEERRIMADWIYGCDVCQTVCPKNENIPRAFEVCDPTERIDLDAIEGESNRSFKRHYGHLSGSWRGAKQWKKNARYIRAYFRDRKR